MVVTSLDMSADEARRARERVEVEGLEGEVDTVRGVAQPVARAYGRRVAMYVMLCQCLCCIQAQISDRTDDGGVVVVGVVVGGEAQSYICAALMCSGQEVGRMGPEGAYHHISGGTEGAYHHI